jgi:hypothetical protein
MLDGQPSRTRFDRGDVVPLDAESIKKVRSRISEGEADKGDGVALYHSLHRLFGFEIPDAYKVWRGPFSPARGQSARSFSSGYQPWSVMRPPRKSCPASFTPGGFNNEEETR